MTKSSVVPFKFESHNIRAISIDGEPWFVAQDICSALGLSNPTMSLKSLDEDERSMFNIGLNERAKLNLGLDQRPMFDNRVKEISIISESGMYTLVLRCRDAIKKGSVPHRFRKWVTAEVLPSIRKTGTYESSRAIAPNPIPTYRYLVTLTYKDRLTGEEKTFTGGANNPGEIVQGTAKRFGYYVTEMLDMPVTAYY